MTYFMDICNFIKHLQHRNNENLEAMQQSNKFKYAFDKIEDVLHRFYMNPYK